MSMSYRQLASRPSCNQAYQIESPVQNGDCLYLDKTTSDVSFVFESAETDQSSSAAPATGPVRISAHRVLLANNSEVFKQMFYCDGGESKVDVKDVPTTDVPITDVTPEAFKEFLQFFYLIEVELHTENISGVLYLGHKYKHMQCVELCAQFLKDIANPDNILFIMSLAIEYNPSDLLDFCQQFICTNTDAVLESNGFLECEQKTLAYCINANLFGCSEVKLFEACMEWVKAKSKQNVLTKEIVDEYLCDLFYEIRFGSMTIQDLCNLSLKYDAVLSDDFKTITKLIVLPNFHSEKFNTRPRQIRCVSSGCLLGCNNIENNPDIEFDDVCNDDAVAFGKNINNFKRKGARIFLTNKRLRLISATCNEIPPDLNSSDDDVELPSEKIKKDNN